MKGLKPFWKELLFGNRGGGGDDEDKVTTVTPPPITPPSATDIAAEQMKLYQQYAPQQLGLGEQRAGAISQQLASPQFMTPEQQAAQEAIRGRETNRLVEALRTRANLGGGLYGGRAAGTEERAVSQMGQGYAQQDIANQQNRMMGLLGMGGGINPQAMIPGAGTQYAGQLQTAMQNAPQMFFQPGQAGSSGSGAGMGIGGALGLGLGALLAAPTGGLSLAAGAGLGAGAGGLFGGGIGSLFD